MFLAPKMNLRSFQRSISRVHSRKFSGGISFDLTEDQTAYQTLARQFAKDEITPAAAKYDKSMEFPHQVFDKVVII